MTIQIESEIIRGMAGEVKYHTKPCPHDLLGFYSAKIMVGSTQCQLCQHYGGTTSDSLYVVCNHK